MAFSCGSGILQDFFINIVLNYKNKLYFYGMNSITKEKVKASGFKYNHLATLLDVHPQYFSMVMRGERNLSLDKENKLKEILKDVVLPLSTVA